jgi:nuclear control of ATPase protein 2
MRSKTLLWCLLLLLFALLVRYVDAQSKFKPKKPRFGKSKDHVSVQQQQAIPEEPSTRQHSFRLSPFHFDLNQEFKDILDKCYSILLFKPPVGIVALLAAARLLFTGRIFRLYHARERPADGVLRQEDKKRRKKRRSALYLDPDDASYDAFGGVQRIRLTLCSSAVGSTEALQVTCRAGTTLFDYVHLMAGPMARLETALMLQQQLNHNSTGIPKTDTDFLLQMAAKVAEIRTLDALLRLSRDGLVKTSSRLFRQVKYWRHRVALSNNMGRISQSMLKAAMEGDRMRLAFANGAYRTELGRLGTIQKILLERPSEMDEQDLVKALTLSSPLKKRPPFLSRFALRWNADGNGRLTIRYYGDDMEISTEAAMQVLLNGNDKWMDDANEWTCRARDVLLTILEEATPNESSEVSALQAWHHYDGEEQNWKTVLTLVDGIADHRRVGEGRVVGIADARQWTDRMDVMGIPSSLAAVGLARIAHSYFIPIWPDLRTKSHQAFFIVWGIIETRFWGPLKGIVLDLMNKTPSLLEAFDVKNEEMSLDNMLRDLGFGDGTEAARKEGLIQAARQYESDLKNGMFRNAMRGRLIRLLLVQIQQLKAGLLSAMASIDVLVAANRLNIQLLTAIPAVLLVTFGTRLFLRSLYSLRMKDIRPIQDVHAEMAELLDRMETRLLLGALTPVELGEFVLTMHSYLVLLDFCSPPFPGRSCDAIRKSMQDMLQQSRDRQAALLHLVKQKHMDLLKYL